MCGRFAFYSPAEAAIALFGTEGSLELEPRYNIAPTQDVAAVRESGDGKREAVLLRWGLVPFWAKDPAIGQRMINARAETVAEKPAYRAAYRHRRCLVLADGFYEWHAAADGKTPYFIARADRRPIAFAGLWEHWQPKDGGEAIESATLITTEANEFMAQLHQRMPVILDPGTADRWLEDGDDGLEFALGHPPRLTAWPVDRNVNNPRHEGESLIVARGDALTE